MVIAYKIFRVQAQEVLLRTQLTNSAKINMIAPTNLLSYDTAALIL